MDNKPLFADRIKSVLSALETTPHKFANEHGFYRASLFNLTKADKRPSFELVERICEVEPRISAEYLLRGAGAPLRTVTQTQSPTTAQHLQAFRTEVNQIIDRRIQELEQFQSTTSK